MKRYLIIAVSLLASFSLYADTSCMQGTGFWTGKFSYKDKSQCQLKYPEMCEKVGIAIGIKYNKDQDNYQADIYPQRGIAGTDTLQCDNGVLKSVNNPEAKISFQCDDLDNCVAKYEDQRLKSALVKMWKEDFRIN